MLATVEEIAPLKRSTRPMSGRVLQLMLLAPDIDEAILDDRQQDGIALAVPMQPVTFGWRGQMVVRS